MHGNASMNTPLVIHILQACLEYQHMFAQVGAMHEMAKVILSLPTKLMKKKYN